MFAPVEPTIEGWAGATLSPADMDRVAEGIAEDVSHWFYMDVKTALKRAAKLGIIYRELKENYAQPLAQPGDIQPAETC